MSNWLFDLGNSRLKAAPLHDDGSLGEVVALAHGASSFLEDLQAALPAHGDSACLSSVASPGLTTAIVEILASRYQRVSLARSVGQLAGVRIAYADLSGGEGYAISSNPIGRNRVQIGFGSRLQSRMGTFAAELQFTRSNTSFQRGLRLSYTTRY